MDEGKHKSRKEIHEVKDGDSKRSHRDRDRDRTGERGKDKNDGRHRDREKRDRESRRHERERSTDSEDKYDREREKRKDKDKDVDRERGREKKRERDRDRDDRERTDRVREKEKERERKEDKERIRERERERRDHEREKEKERERVRRAREREKRREVDSDYSDGESRERDRKRHKKEDGDYKKRERERSVSKPSRQSEEREGSPRKKTVGDDSDTKDGEKKPTREEEMENEQKRLDEEMEKRRRRVQEWQELRRKKEEAEREKHGEVSTNEPESGKTWTLEGESDDEEGPGTEKHDTGMDVDEDDKPADMEPKDVMVVDTDNGTITSDLQEGTAGTPDDEEIDPLDAFMNSMVLPEVEKLNNAVTSVISDKAIDIKAKDKGNEQSRGAQSRKGSNKSIGRIIPGEESDSDYADDEVERDPLDEDDDEFMKRVKKTKAEKLSLVDHSKIDYEPFKKTFYIEVKEISKIAPEEAAAYRKQLELKIHGKDTVPNDLKTLADSFMAKVNQGLEQAHGTGYGGSGFKFNEEEDEVRRAAKKAQAKEYGFEEDKSDSEDEDEGIRKAGGDISQHPALAQILAATKVNAPALPTPISAAQLISNGGLPVSFPSVLGLQTPTVLPGTGLPLSANDGAARAALAAMNLHRNIEKIQSEALPEHYEAELEINDFPQNARWKVTHKETLGPISDWTGAAITTRGQFFPPGKIPGPGERKLYLFIEGPTEQSVKTAKAQLKRVLEDITNQALQLPGGNQPGKYSVV
ncbi:ATP-dependent RNA helicase DDX46/PRP5 [Vigna unguiculata]|uniref:ATP-dependent RNA helicase DDX46/PRP5 n=1 Tax=Vigna unguiculata TaxID=3917 RepID=A0A4D6LRY5_VIGUN|nr:ATP-dependent RNA helicase DDX46/PRP5 [Vigna unguiculata]